MGVGRRRDIWDVLVLGGGAAGLAAAWQCARRGLATALFESNIGFGGQVSTVNLLEDWPGAAPVGGAALCAQVSEQGRTAGVEYIHQHVDRIGEHGPHVTVETAERSYRARSIVIATGARLKTLGVPGEERLRGRGVSQCADCDGFFFRGQDVVVVGGGDSALQEALILRGICSRVSIIARSALRARRDLVDRAIASDNISFIWQREVTEIAGDDQVRAVTLSSSDGAAPLVLDCAAVFPFVGLAPCTDFLDAAMARDGHGFIITDSNFRLSDPRLLAIGSVRSGGAGTLMSAMGEAASVARQLELELKL